MNQSTFIFGMLFIAFVVFITARGELPTYIQLLTGQGRPDSAGGGAASAAGATGRIGAAGVTGAQTGGIWGAIRGLLGAPGAITGLPLLP